MQVSDSGIKNKTLIDLIASDLNELTINLNKQFVNVKTILEKTEENMSDDITMSQLEDLVSEVCASFVPTHPDHAKLGAYVCIKKLHRNTDTDYLEVATKLHNKNLVSDSFYKTVQRHHVFFNKIIDYSRDFNYDYFGFKTLERSYLFKIKDQIVERPQHMLMRVAIGIHGENLDLVSETYNLMSHGYFTHASPTLFNSGTNRTQMSSCFLIGTQDSLDGILKTIKDCGMISKWAGGIGVHVSNIRSKGSLIRGTNGKSEGIVPMLRVYDAIARYCNQGGKRNGSVAVYLEPWHADVEGFLELKKETGSETERARDLFLALWVPDLFMRRVEEGGVWSLMCPDECPGLTEVFGTKFEELYMAYEKDKKYRKQMPARDLFQKILEAQMEGGMPYMCYKDHANNKSNQKNSGTIKSSNLCAEIMEISDQSEYGTCNLASISLPKFIKADLSFDYKELSEVARVVTRNLNKVIDINYYPTEETKKSNMRHRPIGVGVQGLADTFALLKISFESDEAREINKKIFEAIYYGCLRESCELAKKEGPYETFKGSPFSQGILQFDMWGCTPNNWDWHELKQDIMTYGVRNSLLTALMPTASTSQILGNNECFEPFSSNLYTRSTLAGIFPVINKYLIDDLVELGLWNDTMKQTIMYYNGSIQRIENIPDHIKKIYKTVWELKQKVIVDMSVDRGPFVDQSQSLNICFKNISFQTLRSSHFYGWKHGLKTGMYYLRTKPSSNPIQFTLDPELVKKLQELDAEFDKEYKLEKEVVHEPVKLCKYKPGVKLSECEMCSG